MSDSIRAAAQEMMQGRLAAVERAADAARSLDSAREALAAAETSYASEHRAALDAGWSERELRQLGLSVPTKRGPGRPRKRSTPAPSDQGTPTGE